MGKYRIKEVTFQDEIIFILLDGEASIKEGNKISDENSNVFLVKAVMSICTGCTMCSDTMLNVRMLENKGDIGKEITGGQL